MFKTKVISSDRARFARAGLDTLMIGVKQGENEEIAFQTWFNMIEKDIKNIKQN